MKWLEYIYVYGRGMRLFLGKESMDTLAEGKKRKILLQTLHNTLLFMLYGVLLTILYYFLKAQGMMEPILKAIN